MGDIADYYIAAMIEGRGSWQYKDVGQYITKMERLEDDFSEEDFEDES